MIKDYFSAIIISLVLTSMNAQFVDNMESYTDGEPISEGHWTDWGCFGGPGCAIMSSSVHAQDGNLSGYIPGDNSTDAVLNLGGQLFGEWGLSFWMYVPSGKEAYWNLQGQVPIGNGEWIVGNIQFNKELENPNTGIIDNSFEGPINFGFPHDQWFRVVMNYDLDNGVFDAVWQLNIAGADVIPMGTPFNDPDNTPFFSLGGVNFFSSSNNIQFWLDNFVFENNFLTIESDTENPVANCHDVTMQLDSEGSLILTGYDIEDGSTDDFGVVSFIADPSTFDCDEIGEYTVTLTVSDATGNSDSCTASVTVVDNLNPVVLGRNVTGNLDGSSSITIPVSEVDLGSYDNCALETLILTPDTFTETGTYTALLEGSDPTGNTDSMSVIITIIDGLGFSDHSISNFSMYPNPVTDIVTVEAGDGLLLHQLKIYDLTGKRIIDNVLEQSAPLIQIDIANLNTGTYFVEISDEFGNSAVKRLIKE